MGMRIGVEGVLVGEGLGVGSVSGGAGVGCDGSVMAWFWGGEGSVFGLDLACGEACAEESGYETFYKERT